MVDRVHALTVRAGTWQETTRLVEQLNHALRQNRDRQRCSTLTGALEDAYAASVQLSHRPRTQVLEGRPSRSRGQG